MQRGLEGLEGFMVEDRDDSREVGAPAGRAAGAWKPASRRSGTRRWRCSRSATPALPGDAPGDARGGADWLLGEEVPSAATGR